MKQLSWPALAINQPPASIMDSKPFNQLLAMWLVVAKIWANGPTYTVDKNPIAKTSHAHCPKESISFNVFNLFRMLSLLLFEIFEMKKTWS